MAKKDDSKGLAELLPEESSPDEANNGPDDDATEKGDGIMTLQLRAFPKQLARNLTVLAKRKKMKRPEFIIAALSQVVKHHAGRL